MSDVRRRLLLGSLFVVLMAAVVQPTPSQLTSHLPANLGDPALITWILSWGGHALTSDPLGYFDAGIFWPNRAALAYSDPLTPLVPVFGAVWLASSNWSLALNLTLLSLVVLNLAATYSLGAWLTGSTSAGVVGAIAFAFGAYVQAHWGHIQLQSLGFLPLALWLLFKVLDGRRVGLAALLGAVNAALILSALYYGAIYAVSVLVIVAGYVLHTRLRPGPGLVRALGVTAAVTAALVLPAAVPYLRAQDDAGLKRPLEPAYGLNLVDVVTPALGSRLYDGRLPSNDDPDNVEHRFFPGFVTLALASGGLVVLAAGAVGRRRSDGPADPEEAEAEAGEDSLRTPDRRVYLVLLCAAGLVALVLAVGPTVAGQPAPYRLLHRYVPGFNGIRVTSRLAVVTLLAGAMLAAWGFHALASRMRAWRPAAAMALSIAVPAVMLVEAQVDLPWARLPRPASQLAVYRALDELPPGAAVELPMADPRVDGAQWAFVESPRMVYATIDWHPRVNGYSGFIPPDYLVNINAFNAFPAPEALARAREIGVRYVILHVGDEFGYAGFTPAEADAIVAGLPPDAEAIRAGRDVLVDLGP